MIFASKFSTILLVITSLFFIAGCGPRSSFPTEFPTPPPAIPASPISKLEKKSDVELENRIRKIAAETDGRVGVFAVVLETGDSVALNADEHFPMQSVYKLPIAMAILEQFRREDRSIDEKVYVTKDDMVSTAQHSPLRDANPQGGEFSVRELIRLSLIESDGTASDVLLRVAGGPEQIQDFLTQIGIEDTKVVSTEKEIGKVWGTQYLNWTTPYASTSLLRHLFTTAGNSESEDNVVNNALIVECMGQSTNGSGRLKGLLPKGTLVPHKTGTSSTLNGLTAATNDIGLLYLPNGDHIAISVFVCDSNAEVRNRESVIAKIARAVWDKWNREH